MTRPAALLFDLNGTLFPADSAACAFQELGLPASSVELWFSRVLRDGFAAQLAGAFLPFKHFACHHLGALMAAHGCSDRVMADEALTRVMGAWSAADLFPDASPALRALHASGLKLALLTNGSAEAVAVPVLRKAGIEGCFTALLDIGEAGAWKPAQQSYAFAAERLGLEPGQVMLVANHAWDVHGALQAGLQAAYVQRNACEGYPPFLPLQPQLVVADFAELADKLGEM